MTQHSLRPSVGLRILYLEDNPLIVFHVEQLLEDLGHVLVAALNSFADLQKRFSEFDVDAALVDIDLADGSTGPAAAAWLVARNVPTIFVTGQERIAALNVNVSVAIISKPISAPELAKKLDGLRSRPSQGG